MLTCTEQSVPNGTWYYAVTPIISQWSGTESGRGSVTVTATVGAPSPTSGHTGDSVTISGSGFVASHALTVTVGGTSATITSGGTSDASGHASITFTVPTIPAGSKAVVVSDGTNTATSGTNFTVTPKITLSPTTGNVGTTVTVSGSGFGASKTITATYGGASVSLGGTTTTDGTGSFSGATFTVPASTVGAHTVTITDASSNGASASLTVSSKITLSPTSGNVGDTVTISGSGFAASSSISTHTYDGVTVGLTPAAPTSDTSGSFSATFTAPASVTGSHTVSVTDASANSASATLTVAPKITLVATSGGSNDTVTINGTGFGASKAVTATFAGTSVTLGGSTTTGATGSFSGATFTVPPNALSGPNAVQVTDASSNSASASFLVNKVTYTEATKLISTTTGTAAQSTPSFTLAANTTYLVIAQRAAGNKVCDTTAPTLNSTFTGVTFTSIATQCDASTNPALVQTSWWVKGTGSDQTGGTITLSGFTQTNTRTVIEIVRMSGNNTTSPIAQSNPTNSAAAKTVPTATLTSPNSANGEVVIFGTQENAGASAPTPTPTMTNLVYSGGGNGSGGMYVSSSAAATETFGSTTFHWATLAIEIAHY